MKSLIKQRGLSILIVTCILLFLSSCKKDTDNSKITKSKVAGYAQKGPFVNGTSIQMFELNSSLDQTGKVFNTQITNNKGSFEINDINLSSQYVQFSANGYYFNEISGEVSVSPLTLNAISDITDISTVNVNILTHLEKSRVEYLFDNGKSFTEAKEIAQSNVLAIFGYQLDDMDPSELLDITLNKEQNAILMAISLILQGKRSIGDMTELMANIVMDIRQDGQLNDNGIMTELVSSAGDLDLPSIRSNLQARYAELGLNIVIPNFEQYIIDFISQRGSKPSVYEVASTNIDIWQAKLTGIVNANGVITNVSFEYGTTTNYGYSIDAEQNPVTGTSNTSVAVQLTNLAPDIKYHYRIKATNLLGTSYSADSIFTTLGAPAEVITGNAMYLSSDGALVTGYVNAKGLPTKVLFEYGTTTDYGYLVGCGINGIPVSPYNPVSPDDNNALYIITGHSNVEVNVRISGLAPETEYHYRIYAFNDYGITFPVGGEDHTFTTSGTIEDIDENIYKIVQLPDGIWMAENLKTTKYNNGDIIETTIPDTLAINDSTIHKYQWAYAGNVNNVAIYGRLYTWYAVTDNRGVCPTGWHIPSLDEWNTLSSSLGGEEIAGGRLKESITGLWIEPNLGATNKSGFTALPGGQRRLYNHPVFIAIGTRAIWWTSTESSEPRAYFKYINNNSTKLLTSNNIDKAGGFSIRCKKN